jgi:hypothetical protein
MKKDVANLFNGVTEFVLLGVLVTTFVASFYVASNIYPNNVPDQVLGATTGLKNRNFKTNNSQEILKFNENEKQIEFDILAKFSGGSEVLIDLGKITNTSDNPVNYRINLSTAEVYQKDFNVYLQVTDKDYDLLVDGQQFNNDLLLAQGASANCKLKFVPNKPIYFQVESNLIIYK